MNATQTPAPIAGLEPTLPTAWYRSEEAFRVEKERIFWREWMCVGRDEELPGAGAHRVLDIAGESIVVVRNQEGVLRGFYNVCRHRGTRLCHSADVQSRCSRQGAAQPALDIRRYIMEKCAILTPS